jgi:hypothetical protein
VVHEIQPGDLDLPGQAAIGEEPGCFGRRPSAPAAHVQPSYGCCPAGAGAQLAHDVYAEFPTIAVGAAEGPFAVHHAVRHDRRVHQRVLIEQPRHSGSVAYQRSKRDVHPPWSATTRSAA